MEGRAPSRPNSNRQNAEFCAGMKPTWWQFLASRRAWSDGEQCSVSAVVPTRTRQSTSIHSPHKHNVSVPPAACQRTAHCFGRLGEASLPTCAHFLAGTHCPARLHSNRRDAKTQGFVRGQNHHAGSILPGDSTLFRTARSRMRGTSLPTDFWGRDACPHASEAFPW